MRLLRFLSAVILAASVNIGGADAADDVPVRLGAVYGLTGDWSPFDVPSTRGAQLFVKHANARGGVLGRPLALVVRDTEGNIDKAAEAVGSLIAEHPDMPAIFGLSESDPVIAAAKLAATDRRIFVTSGATSPKLPSQVPTWLFLACFGDNVQAAAAAEYAYDKLNARSASVAYDDSHTYTRLLQGYFIDSFKALGGEIRSVVKLAGAEDLANATGDLAPADIVFLAAETPPEAYAGVQTLRAAGFAQPIVGGDGFDGETVWSQDPDLEDVYYSTHAYFGGDHPSPEAVAFREAYMAEYDGVEPGSFAGLGYDAAGLLAAAIEKAGSTETQAVLDALSTLQNFHGVTGTISFVDGSRIPLKSVTIIRVADGKRNFAEQIVPAHVANP
jgi:branched-chain amino acid transport system substrate-binding protein